MLHQVGDLFELNVKLRCQKLNGQKPEMFPAFIIRCYNCLSSQLRYFAIINCYLFCNISEGKGSNINKQENITHYLQFNRNQRWRQHRDGKEEEQEE